MLIRPLVLIGLVVMLATTGCNRTDRRLAFSAHSKSAIPKTATLIHSGAQYAGFDASYGFVFDVTDGAVVDQRVHLLLWHFCGVVIIEISEFFDAHRISVLATRQVLGVLAFGSASFRT
ncbi:hypothetical protein VN12_25030 [Pirellula sp. SH-Sr6A]|nr:hypothetical protein VN12_25030 [Pirellula sp. SH-Sr6A]